MHDTSRPAPDRGALDAILAELFEPYADIRGGQLEACAIWPDKDEGKAPLALHFTHDRLKEAERWLAERNADGWSIYIGAGLRRDAPARGRASKPHVVQSRWLWADFDAEGAADTAKAKLAAIDFLPTFWVQTGTKPYARWHAWWRLAEPIAGKEAEGLLRRMVGALDADPAPKSRSGVMRLPGGVAWPKPDKPGRVAELVTRHKGSGRSYGKAEVEALVEVLAPTPKPKAKSTATRGRAAVASAATSAQVAELLRWIDPGPLHYDDWLRVGMALHEAGEPIDTWESWSSRSPKHDESDMQRRWDSFGRTSSGLTVGTLFHMAGQAGADLAEIARMGLPETKQRAAGQAQGVPVSEARRALAETVNGFWKRCKDRKAPAAPMPSLDAMQKARAARMQRVEMVNATLGLGKTDATLRMVAEAIKERRAVGDEGAVVALAAPMHRLSDQMAADFQRIAPELRAAVLRGPEADDPDKPGEPVCKQLDKYREARALLLDPEAEVCRSCPHRSGCRVLLDRLAVADVYIVAHQALGGTPPQDRQGPPAWWVRENTGKARRSAEEIRPREGQHLLFTVVDEDPTGALMFGADVPRVMGLDAWQRAPDGDDEQLRAARAWLARVVERNGEGPLRRESLLANGSEDLAGLGAVLGRLHADAGAKLEWHRKASKGAGKEALEHNRTVRACAAIWRELADFLGGRAEATGRLEVVVDAEKGLALRHAGVREVKDGWKEGGMLLLDATGRAEVAEAVLGEPVKVHNVTAAQPMLRVVQDASRAFGKSMLVPGERYRNENADKAAANNVRKLAAWVTAKAAAVAPRKLGLVTYKTAVEALEDLDLPENVMAGWFGNLRGMNNMQDVAELVVVGRPMPEEHGLARMAAALTAQPVAGRYDLTGETERLVSASGGLWWRTGYASRHPDPMAQTLLESIRDGEVMQAVGRARAVNRAEPVTVWLLSDAVMPWPVELAEIWQDVCAQERDPIAWQLAAGGIAFTSPAAAASAYPERWRSKQAAAKALTGQLSLYESIPIRKVDQSPLWRVEYRIPRSRAPAVAVVDLARHPDPVAALLRVMPTAVEVVVLDMPPKVLEAAPEAAEPPPVAHNEIAKPPVKQRESLSVVGGYGESEAEIAAQAADSAARLGAALVKWQATPAGKRAVAVGAHRWMQGQGVAAAPP